jgi:hypothetical protein
MARIDQRTKTRTKIKKEIDVTLRRLKYCVRLVFMLVIGQSSTGTFSRNEKTTKSEDKRK